MSEEKSKNMKSVTFTLKGISPLVVDKFDRQRWYEQRTYDRESKFHQCESCGSTRNHWEHTPDAILINKEELENDTILKSFKEGSAKQE